MANHDEGFAIITDDEDDLSCATHSITSFPGNVFTNKQKARRLLLLRHASKCQAEHGNCKLSYCGRLKQLWEHVKECREQNCEVPHCMSSMSVLRHYRKCNHSRCQICEPVRDDLMKVSRGPCEG